MWWSPDSRKLAFYEIDERHLQDYYLTVDNVEVFPQAPGGTYPNAGMPNPNAGLLIYNLESKLTTRVDVGGTGCSTCTTCGSLQTGRNCCSAARIGIKTRWRSWQPI